MHRVQRFFDSNGVVFAEINTSGARARLDTTAANLAASANDKEGAKLRGMGETSKQQTLRAALLKQMRSVARIAASELDTAPELSSLWMPSDKTPSHALIEAANAIAGVGMKYSDMFIQNGLPSNFVDRLLAAIAALEASYGDRNEFTGRRVTATAGTIDAAKRGRKLIKVLGALVKVQLAADDPLAAAWTSAKRFHAAASRSADSAANPTGTTVVAGAEHAGQAQSEVAGPVNAAGVAPAA
jgi:hypothetical protein